MQDQAYSTCFSGGSNPDWNCDPANPECYTYCYNTQCCYDPYGYECGGGNYYSSFNWSVPATQGEYLPATKF